MNLLHGGPSRAAKAEPEEVFRSEVAKLAPNQVVILLMATVSDQLRNARESQALDIYQVAEITKIKTDHLRALESGNFAVFSAPVYIRGFVRTYATMLKLNVKQVLGDLDAELGKTAQFRDPPALSPPSRGAVDYLMLKLSRMTWKGATVLLGLLLVIGIIALMALSRKAAQPAESTEKMGSGLYPGKSNQRGETVPIPQAPRR